MFQKIREAFVAFQNFGKISPCKLGIFAQEAFRGTPNAHQPPLRRMNERHFRRAVFFCRAINKLFLFEQLFVEKNNAHHIRKLFRVGGICKFTQFEFIFCQRKYFVLKKQTESGIFLRRLQRSSHYLESAQKITVYDRKPRCRRIIRPNKSPRISVQNAEIVYAALFTFKFFGKFCAALRLLPHF